MKLFDREQPDAVPDRAADDFPPDHHPDIELEARVQRAGAWIAAATGVALVVLLLVELWRATRGPWR